MTARMRACIVTVLAASVLGGAARAEAQYFGRNKVQYRTFDFRVLQTDHFDIYYYPEEKDAAEVVARLAERWYARLSRFFDHELRGRQAVILYASPEHFRQTNAVEGLIGEGTGGVTESLRRRVIVPMAGTLADTDHVLGHELVHAFQFDMTGAGLGPASSAGPAILGYPLWFVEGMAEYVSLGPVDPQTSMWLRDAVATNQLPTVRDLENTSKFFPYRWGQAFWAYVGARWGDKEIASLLRSAVNPSVDLTGMALQLGTDPKSLDEDWHRAIRAAAAAAAVDQPTASSEIRRVIGGKIGANAGSGQGGRINVGPMLSPDGSRVAFFSEHDLFSIDLYVADARTGRIERRLIHTATDPHFDSLQFLDSAGTWSPDGRSLALTVVRGGKPALVTVDASSGDVQREWPLAGLADAINPSWSPDGRTIVFSGNRGGFTDLYRLVLATGAVEALTNDAYGDLEPTFTPDGASLVFVTDRFSTDLAGLVPGPLQLAWMDLATKEIRPIPGFLHGQHLSPQVSADGRTVTFVAEPDGVPNVYRMAIDGGPISRLTSVSTGVAGITTTSPTLSMAATTGELAFSVFENAGNAIYTLDTGHIVATVAPEQSTAAEVLPPRTTPEGVVNGLLGDFTRGLPSATYVPPDKPYRSRLHLDSLVQPSVSAGVSTFGPQVGGGMSMQFSDMLGDRSLGVGAYALTGSVADLGGAVQFLNRRHRWNWAVDADQTPYAIGFLTDEIDAASAEASRTLTIYRETTRGGTGIAQFAINESDRLEAVGDARHFSFTEENRTETYSLNSGLLVSNSDQTVSTGRSLNLAEVGIAFVHDASFFGMTSPIYGNRARFELSHTIGTLQYTGVLADVRQYAMPVRPITLGFRLLHFGRYGPGAEDPEVLSLYAGDAQFVHGYGYGSFSTSECQAAPRLCGQTTSLFGSRLFVANFEVRAPLVGLFKHSVTYGPLPVEVAAFYDVGGAWTSATRLAFSGPDQDVIRSAGGAVRFNLFNIVVLEISAAHPFDRPDKRLQWQAGLRLGF